MTVRIYVLPHLHRAKINVVNTKYV